MLNSMRKTLFLALVLRIILVWWAELQDSYFSVSYTDIDYQVFNDAAQHVVNHGSPFDRDTYRYTPLLAWILTPNIIFAKNFGKYLFCLCDIIVGVLIYQLSLSDFQDKKIALTSCKLWLFNPVTVVVSTRGSADSLVTLLVLATLRCHHKKQWALSGLLYGLAVHFKIYPVTYFLTLYFCMGKSILPNIAKLKFSFTFLLSLVFWTWLGYYYYGWQFIDEAYLYHVIRKDVKHNFSVYFYLLYLTESISAPWLPLVTFVPQLLMLLYLSYNFRGLGNLNFAVFCETFVFVTFNKVVTSQYFLWYLSLLPLCWPLINLRIGIIQLLSATWLASQAMWLFSAYLLEFQGLNTFLFVWISSLVFFVVNIVILSQIIRNKIDVKKTV